MDNNTYANIYAKIRPFVFIIALFIVTKFRSTIESHPTVVATTLYLFYISSIFTRYRNHAPYGHPLSQDPDVVLLCVLKNKNKCCHPKDMLFWIKREDPTLLENLDEVKHDNAHLKNLKGDPVTFDDEIIL